MGRFEDRFGIDYSTQQKRGESEGSRDAGYERESQRGYGPQEYGRRSAGRGESDAPYGSVKFPEMWDDALISFGRPMLEKLAEAPDKTRRLFDLAQALGVRVDVSLRVAEYLRSRDYVKKIEDDTIGNDVLQLTAGGAQFLSGKTFN